MKTINFALSFLVLLCAHLQINAQHFCGTMDYLSSQIQQDSSVLDRMEAIETFTKNYIKNNPTAKSGLVYSIPVVVHVVHNNSTENISNAQINSQIAILNQDFRRTNTDADNTWSAAADTEIEFCLATLDPQGNPTTGITRTHTNSTQFTAPDNPSNPQPLKYTAQGGRDAWPRGEYLNMWVCDLGGGVLGYAQFPGSGPAATDGIVVDYTTVGNTGTATFPYHLGRVATHEVGHWLNLRHTWGDGPCGTDDFVTDTPQSDAPNFSCPVGHVSCGTTDMVQNYMDYTNDNCKNLFTAGQKTRMRAVLATGGFRASLDTSQGCSSPLPDLTIDNQSSNPPSGTPGTTTVNTTCRIRNIGTGSAGNSVFRYYLSTNPTFETSDLLVGSQTIVGLADGSSVNRSFSFTLPSGLSSGIYYILYRADATEIITESDETNNLVYTTITVNANLPDLTILNQTANPTSGAPGTLINLACVVRNIGTGTASASTLRYYFSSNQTYEAGDNLIASDAVSSLAAGGQNSEGHSFSIPLGTAPGTYYVLFVADATGVVVESNETNNLAYAAITVSAGLPDLRVVNTTSTPSSGTVGSNVNVTCRVYNYGQSAAAPSTLRYYLSNNTTYSSNDIPIGLDFVGQLIPNGNNYETLSFNIPSVPTGTYYILFVADADNAVTESNENNNVAYRTLVVNASLPDLRVINQASSPSSGIAGITSVTTSCVVRNYGNATAGASTLKYYLSTNSTYSTNDTYLGSDAVGTLAAGTQGSENFSFTLPSGLNPGTYYILFRADANLNVSESNENNNVSYRTISVNASLPDLRPISQTASPSSGSAGTSISASCYVRNYGTATAGASTLRYYLSSNITYSTNDILLGTDAVGTLQASAQGYESHTFSVPSGLNPGTYYVLFIADIFDTVNESNENNNVSYKAITINASLPDLQVTNHTASPTSVVVGDYINVSSIVRNNGNGSAGVSRLNYYLSTNSTYSSNDTYLGNSYVAALAPGASSTETSAINTASLTPGTYYLLFRADGNETVTESNENNNVVYKTITINQSYPDLWVYQHFTTPKNGTAGTNISATCKVGNIGNGQAGASVLKYYLSSNTTYSSNDIFLGQKSISSLQPTYFNIVSHSFNIPSGLSPGTYYVLFRADANSQVAESNESNNVSYASIIVSNGLPDLRATNLSVSPDVGVTGSVIDISCQVRNYGTGTGGFSYVKYYLSTNSTYDSGDRYLGLDYVNGLAGGSSSNETHSFTIPSGLTPNIYYVLFVVDANSNVYESNEANNTVSKSMIIVPNLPDLRVVNQTSTPATAGAGTNVSINCRVQNFGTATSGNNKIRYYLSTNTTYSTNDVFLGYDDVGILTQGSYSFESHSFTIPASTTPGNYYILFRADADGNVAELNEANNLANRPITITGLPDLRVTNTSSTPTTANAGASVSTSCRVQNFGSGFASYSYIRYYLSTNPTYSTNDTYLGYDYVSPLNPGSYNSESHSFILPTGLSSGTYYILFRADATSNVTESNESNNVAFRTITVNGLPDLRVINHTSTPSSGTVGTNVNLSSRVQNYGSAPAGGSYLKYYLSTNTTYSSNDVLLGTDYVSSLNPGAFNNEAHSFSIPSNTTPGTYYILFRADANSFVTESNENNNIAYRTFTVTAGQPDLRVHYQQSTPTSGTAGITINTTCRVQNFGVAPAGGSYLRYYLSTNNTYGSGDTYLGYDYVNPLNPGAYNTETHTFTLPNTVTQGVYYILYVADSNNSVTESNESNNVSYTTITVSASTPDLRVDNANSTPSSGSPGTTVNTTCSVKNYGTATAGFSYLHYYISSYSYYNSSATYLGSDYVSSLSAGASSSESYSFNIPSGLSPGTYYILYRADATNLVSELIESNNVVSTPISINGGGNLPDLQITKENSTPTNGTFATIVNINCMVRNSGNATTSGSFFRLYFSTDQTYSTDDVLIANKFVPTLAAGGVSSQSATHTIQAGTTPGTYYILYIADFSNMVAESNEGNNFAYTTINLTGTQADLRAINPSASPSSGTFLTTFTASCRVRNYGPAPAVQSYLTYYLSDDPIYGPGDTYIGNDPVFSLTSGAHSDESISFNFPGVPSPGTYYVLARADGTNTVPESNETNNMAVIPITIVPTPFTEGGDESARKTDIKEDEIEEAEDMEINLTVSPNPASKSSEGFLNVQANRQIGKVQLGIFDLEGRKVYTETLEIESREERIKLPTLKNAGVYVIRLQSQQFVASTKWIVLE